jgi:hypothetical protein
MIRHIVFGVTAMVSCLSLLPAGLPAGEAPAAANRMLGRRFVLNVDCNDYDYFATPGRVQAWMRENFRGMVAGGADVLIADVALPDVVETTNTPTGEVIGARFPEAQRKGSKRNQAIAELSTQSTDVLRLACDEGHRGGALVLAGMRMSDAHHGAAWQPASDNELFASFIMAHPEWCNTWQDGSKDATLNYAVPEVRAHRLAILRELALNYDVDGLELDWMRWCRHFPAGKQREHLAEMTEFVTAVRQMLDEVAHIKGVERMILGHRVAPTMEENLNFGCDLPTWMKNGCADFVSPMDFLFADPNIRTEEFVQPATGTGCLVYPTIQAKYSMGRMYDDNNLYEGKDNHRAVTVTSLDMVRALACNAFAWGAYGGSSFNIYLWTPATTRFHSRTIAIASDPALAGAGPRHYLYLPVWKRPGNSSPTCRENAQSLSFGPDSVGRRQPFVFRMADGRRGEKLKGTLSFRIYDATANDRFAIDLNGQPLAPRSITAAYQPNGEVFDEGRGEDFLPVPTTPPFDHSVPFTWPAGMRYEVSLAKCPPFKGDNELGITLLARDPASDKTPVMEALEVRVLSPVKRVK